MISFGCNTFSSRRYEADVHVARSMGFEFFQIGYSADGFAWMNEQDAPHLMMLIRAAFPVTIHALLRVSELDEHLPRLVHASRELQCKDLIVHPISQTRVPGSTVLSELIEGMRRAIGLFSPHGISLYLENNSGVDSLFSTVEDVKAMFTSNPDLEFLLDVAHVNDYETLCRMVDARMPKILHISDRRADIVHEHLPIGEGDIDFERIMTGPLAQFRGKIIFEVPTTDSDRVAARDHAICWWSSSTV